MKNIFKIFFGCESFAEMRKKGLSLALLVPAIRWGEWALVGVTASLVAFMKSYGLGNVTIFLILWLANVILSGCIVWFNDSVEADITLMEGLRRLVDAAFVRSRWAGFFIELIVFIRLLIWDGPSYFLIFFRKRLCGKVAQVGALVTSSGIQMAIWTVLYIAGYNSFRELLF